ncbi:MAG: hypothetical protein RLW61_04460 [Gammaproteobacteria bacterium]
MARIVAACIAQVRPVTLRPAASRGLNDAEGQVRWERSDAHPASVPGERP